MTHLRQYGVNFTSAEASWRSGLSYRQIDHYDRINLLKPSLRPGRGPGSQRLYSLFDILRLRLVSELRNAGVAVGAIEQALTPFSGHPREWQHATLAMCGDTTTLIYDIEDLVKLLKLGKALTLVPLLPIYDAVQGGRR